ncbi:hypothetical protein WA158_000867 [Blastocystis sp. Blastoise]
MTNDISLDVEKEPNYYQQEDRNFVYHPFDQRKKRGQGIVLMSYSLDNQTARNYFKEAFSIAKSYIKRDKDIHVCLFTNIIPDERIPDRLEIRKIPDNFILQNGKRMTQNGPMKQFYTKTMLLMMSPFKYTLSIDSSAYMCVEGGATKILNEFRKSDVDLSCVNRVMDEYVCVTYALLYRYNYRTVHLFRNMLLAQFDEQNYGDDQYGIKRVLPNAIASHTIKFKFANNAYFYCAANYDKNGYNSIGRAYRISVPFVGPAIFVHEGAQRCASLNQPDIIHKKRYYCMKHLPNDSKNNTLVTDGKYPYEKEMMVFSIEELKECISPYPLRPIKHPLNAIHEDQLFYDV